MSAFWNYFSEKLCWPQLFTQGPLQVVTRGLAHHLDTARDDMMLLRRQFFPEQCEPERVPDHGISRSVVQHPSETPEQFRQRVVHAYGWHRLGGKTLGLPQILKFYGFDVGGIDNLGDYGSAHWAEFDVRLQGATTVTELDTLLASVKTLIWLINEYKPARSVLKRIYTDVYDVRPIRPTKGPILSDGFLSYFSGVGSDNLGTGDTLVSIGYQHRTESDPFAPVDACVGAAYLAHCGILAPYIDTFLIGVSRLGDEFPRNHCFAVGGLFSGFMGEPELHGRKWIGPWADTWIGDPSVAGCDRKLPPWRMEYRSASFSQLSLSEGQILGDENARLGVSTVTLVDTPGRIGDVCLGRHLPGRRVVRIHQFFIENEGYESSAVNPASELPALIAGGSDYAALAPYIDRFTVGVSRLGDEFPRNHCIAMNGHFSGFLGEPELNHRPWTGSWTQPWIETRAQAGCDRKLSPWRMEYRSASFSQLSVGEGQALGNENARLGISTVKLTDTPGRLGDMRLGKHDPNSRVVRIHKFFIETTGHTISAIEPALDTPAGITEAIASVTNSLHEHPDGWRGAWAPRRWWPYVAYVALGHVGMHDELHEVLHTEAPGVTRIPENLFAAA